MTLSFGRYGGEYCVGSLNHIELDNIKQLLRRFDKSVVVGHYETNFDTNDYKENYFDFDDIEHASSVALDGTVWIEDTGDIKLDEDYFSTGESIINVTNEPKLKDGYYICSNSTEKGIFFNVELEINPNDFDKSKLELECKDLDGIGFSDIIITDVKYDGEYVEMDYDSLNTTGKSYEQSLVYAENGFLYEGIEHILSNSEYDNEFEVHDSIYGMDEYEAIHNYLLYIEAWRHGYLLKTDEIIVFASPFLYENFDKDEVDTLWMTEKNIKFALKYNYKDEIPDDVWERIVSRFPEWLI